MTLSDKDKTSDKKKITTNILFSGIQPTGDIHLGNYLGAIKNWVDLVEKYDSIFCIVDYHAMTQRYKAEEMSRRILEAAAVNIAAGLNPEKCTLFVQSHVPLHTELAWILNTVTPVGELTRMTQYKDKSNSDPSNINAGLLTYPVLMAADILIYKASHVPVGEDQIQHLELAREIARHFASRFGELFPEPNPIMGKVKRLKGLDGQAKMSKSKGNTIGLVEDPASVSKKLMQAVTDPARKLRTDPGNPDICNVYSLHKALSDEETISWAGEGCRSAGIGCVQCKKKLLSSLEEILVPIRDKYEYWTSHTDELKDILVTGAVRCNEIASITMAEVRDSMGLLKL